MPLLAHRRVVLRLAVGAVAGFAALRAGAADSPAATLIENVAAQVIELIKTKKGAELETGIRQVLETSFDLSYMGRQALATHWKETNEEQRQRFLAAVVSSEAHAYADRFSQYGGQTLSVGRVVPRPNGVSLVESKLNQSNGQPINIEWEVRDTGQGLRISDVKIEGVSMVMTRRSDFNSYISGHGGQVDALINELEARAKH
ncbi:MAG TPA: ABC transporter substrate-binding protein [Reyranella sp.]|nr:ABC transporter substrate-binding protein [Reyranella sp.]